jgi:FtsP/CotA-like multicopper oxidase with cupredoxin domain
MKSRFALLFVALWLAVSIARACPWCQRFGVKETVSAGQPDPGGKIFGAVPPAEKTRHYYVAAEPVQWAWAPLGINTSKPLPLPPDLVDKPLSPKVRYIQYTDATFTRRVLDTPRLGLVGPILRGVVGEYLAVTFLNRSAQPLSMHPHGVRYDKDNEGAYTEPGPGKGSAVGPGATYTYVWQLDEMSGPQPGEPSSKCWLYHSHCLNEEEINLGLAGFIVVTDPARARPDGTPNDVDRELPAMFFNFDDSPEDETLDPDLIEPLPPPRTPLDVFALRAVGRRPSINGVMFANLPGLEMRAGERVRWYLGALGEDDGMHTAHWHGARVQTAGRQVVDVISMLPGETKVADQLADNPGTWMLHCHVSDHMMEGMFANFVVRPADAPAPPEPFLGMPAAKESLRWTNADLALDLDPQATTPATVKLRGEVAIYRGFFTIRNPPAIRIGTQRVALTSLSPNEATAAGTHWKTSSANAEGVVLAESLEFELTLDGTAWRDALTAAGLGSGTAANATIPIDLELGGVTHTATLALHTKRDGSRVTGSQN